ncbi:MAG: hypothetical protein M5U01_41960 [Ardenticatenaceae bacterium]|nr:hypothetical protein [Ardenticatenaceae bacterium]
MRSPLLLVTSLLPAGWLTDCTRTASSRALIEYRRSGGFAGLDDHLVIQEDGKAILTRKTGRSEFVLDDATMNQLRVLFDEAEFSKLRREYLPRRKGSDLFEYVMTHKGHTVRTLDTAVPESLQPILKVLNQIVESDGRP